MQQQNRQEAQSPDQNRIEVVLGKEEDVQGDEYSQKQQDCNPKDQVIFLFVGVPLYSCKSVTHIGN